jgi:hypothetical protein
MFPHLCTHCQVGNDNEFLTSLKRHVRLILLFCAVTLTTLDVSVVGVVSLEVIAIRLLGDDDDDDDD